MNGHLHVRIAFDRHVNDYEESRPKYPSVLFQRLFETIQLPLSAKVLEIGPGTGQATGVFAERNYEVTAIELGQELAKFLRKKYSTFHNVKIIQGNFETYKLPSQEYDLVYAASAFHWIKPEFQFTLPHAYLREGGHLAIIHSLHVSDEKGDKFYHASQHLYEKYRPEDGDYHYRLPLLEDLKPFETNHRLFSDELFETFPLTIKYTTSQYLQLLSTYSQYMAMDKEIGTKFLREMSQIIDQQFEGSVTKTYAMTLQIARKRSDGAER